MPMIDEITGEKKQDIQDAKEEKTEESEESVKDTGFDLNEFFKAGVHFGHKTSKWNPAMKKNIHSSKDSIHIIDLEKTAEYLKEALGFVKKIVENDGVIVLIGTKKQSAQVVKDAAIKCNMPYVVDRWIGGTFTNFDTIHSQIKKMKSLEKQKEDGELSKYTKKEQMKIGEEIERLNRLMGGIKGLEKLPEAIFVVDLVKDLLPIKEAKKKDIKVVGLADTNTDPKLIDYPIPANDDAISSITLLLNIVADAINEAKTTIKKD